MLGIKGRYRFRIGMPGGLMTGAVLVLLLVSWNTGSNIYYLVFGAILTIVFISLVTGRRMLRRLSISWEAPPTGQKGDLLPCMLVMRNERRALPVFSVSVEAGVADQRSLAYAFRLAPRQPVDLRINHRFERRGVHHFPDVTVRSAFPFGLFEARLELGKGPEVLIYPRVRAVRPTTFEKVRTRSTPRRTRGQGDEYYRLRPYIMGDDPRLISWRASARKRELLIKEFTIDTSRHLVCILDSRITPDLAQFDDYLEDAIDLTASLAVSLLNRQYSVALVTPAETLAMGDGPGHAQHILEFLARLKASPASAPDPFKTVAAHTEWSGLRRLCVSPNPDAWGQTANGLGTRITHPAEVLYA